MMSIAEGFADRSRSIDMSISSIRKRLKKEQTTPRQIYSEHLGVIDEKNEEYRAVLRVADPPIEPLGGHGKRDDIAAPLLGVPILVKDDITTAGIETTAGSSAMRGWVPSHDASAVRRLRLAGATIIAKTNLSEWAGGRSPHELRGWSALGGQTRNAHDVRRSPGGSSAGSAVGVALGMGVAALGSETVGSVVLPAAMNGIAGLKPTMGLVDSSGLLPVGARFTQSTIGPMARTVEDLAQVMAVLSGGSTMARANACARRISRVVEELQGSLRLNGARIGVWRDPAQFTVGAARSILDAESVLAGAGAVLVDDVHLPSPPGIYERMGSNLRYEYAWGYSAFLKSLPDGFPASLPELHRYNEEHADTELRHFGQEWIREQVEIVQRPRNDHHYARMRRQLRVEAQTILSRAFRSLRLTAIMTITTLPAWKIDPVVGDPQAPDTVTLACVSGFPHLSVPGLKYGGLPVGVSLIGPQFSEPRLLKLGHALQRTISGQT